MAIEYRLTLAGDIPLEEVAQLAAPEATEIPVPPGYLRLFGADLYDERGYYIDINGGRGGYYDAEGDDGLEWEWELEAYVDVSFSMRKNVPTHNGVRHMVATVARVLGGRREDAALTLNGNYLLLTRIDGVLRQHRSTWWNNYGVADVLTGP